jgi:hypothetical protein
MYARVLFMIIQSKSGHVLFEDGAKTIRRSLESAALQQIPLQDGSLRRTRARRAQLDDICAPYADFWGSDFTGADLAGANLEGADLRLCQFQNACLAQADLRGADLMGAYFGGAVVDGCQLEGAIFSCPSLFSCDLMLTPGIKGAIYCHRGEQEVVLQDIPITITSRLGRLVFLDPYVLYAGALIPIDLAEDKQLIRTATQQ